MVVSEGHQVSNQRAGPWRLTKSTVLLKSGLTVPVLLHVASTVKASVENYPP